MASHHRGLAPELVAYLRSLAPAEHPVLQQLREDTSRMAESVMQISPEQGSLMQFFIQLIGARRCIEIGVFTGYSALATALALPEDGHIIACDINAEWTRIGATAWEQAGVSHKIDLRLAPASETIEQLLIDGGAGTFDFGFIDADKSNYDVYYEGLLKLIRPGGIFLVDNTWWEGKVIDEESNDPDTVAIRKLNNKMREDPRVESFMLPVGDGLTMVMKK